MFCTDIDLLQPVSAVLLDHWDSSSHIFQPPDTVLGIPEGPYLDQASSNGLAQFHFTIDKLRAAGINIKHCRTFADIQQIDRVHRRLISAEMARVHQAWWPQHSASYRPLTRNIIESGLEIDDAELQSLQRDWESLMSAKDNMNQLPGNQFPRNQLAGNLLPGGGQLPITATPNSIIHSPPLPAQRVGRGGYQNHMATFEPRSPEIIARQQEAKAAYQASPAFAAAVKNFSQPLRGSPLQQTGGSTSGSPVGLGNMMRPRNSGNQLPGGGQFPGLGQGLGGMGLIGQLQDPQARQGLMDQYKQQLDDRRNNLQKDYGTYSAEEIAAKLREDPTIYTAQEQPAANVAHSPFGSGNMRQAVMGQPSPRQAQSQGIVPMLAGPRGRLAGVGFDTSSLTPAYQRARRSAFRT